MFEIVMFFLGYVLDLLLVITGGLVIRLLSFGRWRTESQNNYERRVVAAAGALSFVRDGKRVITTTGLWIAGLAIYLLIALAFLI